jgi:hypothetical protein
MQLSDVLLFALAILSFLFLCFTVRVFTSRGFRIMANVPDGNCMLHSIFPHLPSGSKVNSVDDLRQTLVDGFTKHFNDYSQIFPADLDEEGKQSLVNEISSDGVWDTDTMDIAFHVLSKELGVGVHAEIFSLPLFVCLLLEFFD